MEEEPPPLVEPTPPLLRWAAHVLYLPLIGGLGYMVLLGLLVLAHGKPAGSFALMYGVMLFFIGRRYARIYNGELAGKQLWKDVAALAVIDFMLAVLWIERVS